MQSIDKKTITTSQLLVKTLHKLGIENIFGYPGSAVLSIYDALSQQSDIKHYLLRHEQSAVHAAEGYARVCDKCGVVLVTSGPGASNTITGIANAYLDGYPLIVISGQVNSDLSGKNAFQEINFTDMVKSCTKAVFKISSADELESTLLQGYLIAMTGKKGPVVIDIPKNILDDNTEYKNLALPSDKVAEVSLSDVLKILEILKSSKLPVIVCGGGVVHSKASEELTRLAGFLNIPVVSTMMGIGAFPQNHPGYAGMIGIYGNKQANNIINSSDTILVLGARFNDRITSAFSTGVLNSKIIIQVDINSKELLNNLRADLALNSDIKTFLQLMLCEISNIDEDKIVFDTNIKNEHKLTDVSNKLLTRDVVSALYSYTKSFSPIIATEVGQHQLALIKNYKFNEPQKLLTSGGLGTMGFGFPAAIGASIAMGRKPVVLVTGDGSFQMNLQELAVCVQYKIPVKIMVINNGCLGLVRQLQDEQCAKRYYETSITNPDYVMLAKSYGIDAERVADIEQINAALEKAFNTNEPFVIEFLTDSDENV